MAEFDPSSILGNEVPGATVEELTYMYDEEVWRGDAEGFVPVTAGAQLKWQGNTARVVFRWAEPGIVKEILVDQTHGAEDEDTVAERELLARLMGVEVTTFDVPPPVDPDSLEPAQREEFFFSRNNEQSYYTSGEAFGIRHKLAVQIDPNLAQELYDQAVVSAHNTWTPERLAAELSGVYLIRGDRDEPRFYVLSRYIDEHPEQRDAINKAVTEAMSFAGGPPLRETVWSTDPMMKAAAHMLQEKLNSVAN